MARAEVFGELYCACPPLPVLQGDLLNDNNNKKKGYYKLILNKKQV